MCVSNWRWTDYELAVFQLGESWRSGQRERTRQAGRFSTPTLQSVHLHTNPQTMVVVKKGHIHRHCTICITQIYTHLSPTSLQFCVREAQEPSLPSTENREKKRRANQQPAAWCPYMSLRKLGGSTVDDSAFHCSGTLVMWKTKIQYERHYIYSAV